MSPSVTDTTVPFSLAVSSLSTCVLTKVGCVFSIFRSEIGAEIFSVVLSGPRKIPRKNSVTTTINLRELVSLFLIL